MPAEFPRLGVLNFGGDGEDSRLYSTKEISEHRTELLESLSRGRLRVVVPVGHGATTLARWVVQRVQRDCLRMKTIPVLISLDDLIDSAAALEQMAKVTGAADSVLKAPPPTTDGYMPSAPYVTLLADQGRVARKRVITDAAAQLDTVTRAALDHVDPRAVFDHAVHAAVVRTLVAGQWERVVGEYRYASLLGASDTDQASLRRRGALLLPVADRGAQPGGELDLEWLSDMSPTLADRGALADFLLKNRLDVVVNLDLSCTHFGRLSVRDVDTESSYDEETPWFRSFAMERFLTHIKDQDDLDSDLTSGWRLGADGVINVAEYVSAGINREFESMYQTSTTPIRATAFDPLDVFAVVAAHYPQDRTNQNRPELVSAVMSAGVIEGVARGSRMALTSMTARLEDELSQWESFTYHAQWPAFRNLPERVSTLEKQVEDLGTRLGGVQNDVTLLGQGPA